MKRAALCDCGHEQWQHFGLDGCSICDCPYYAPSEFDPDFPFEDGEP